MRIENFDPKIDINKVKSFVDGWKLETKENRGPFTQLVFSYTSPADDPVVDSCSVTIKLMLLQKTKGALYEYGIIATYRDDIYSYTYKNRFNRFSHSPEQLISVVLAWASRKAFAISEHEHSDIMRDIWNNFDNINKNIPIKESKQINMGSMKLHEEFKLYENMWDDLAALTEAAPKKLKLATPKSSIEVPLTENTKNNYVFIDLSGGSEKFKDELTSAAVADGHKAEDVKYFDDFRFAEATKAAKQGHNVFLYTRDDDYKVNSELEKLPNVKVKMITNLGEALNDAAAKDPNFYNKVKQFVEDWLTGRGLREYCEDSYDNSYNSGNGMHYELQWNFSEVPGLEEVQTALRQALHAISIYAGVNIIGGFDTETLEDEYLINLTVSYDV